MISPRNILLSGQKILTTVSRPAERIDVAKGGYSLPVEDILTGRGFCSGKSGSGKTNTVSVIVEKLLANDLPLLIVDTEGEYYPLKEAYELLHVGPNDDEYDRTISVDSVADVVTASLHQNVPIIVDISGFEEEATSHAIVEEIIASLFKQEKTVQKPYLVVIEEIHEYVPEQGKFDSLAEKIIRVAKRGRKRGLGICGVSQRPAAVAKDYITQCDWLVWHRLTWKNDVDVVRQILGSEYADSIIDLETGEAFLMTDWDEEIRRLKFLRKQTYDVGSTPGLEAISRTDAGTGQSDLTDDIERRPTDTSDQNAGEVARRKDRRIAELEAQVNRLEAKLEESATDEGEANNNSIENTNSSANGDHLVIELSDFLVYLFSSAGTGIKRFIKFLSWVSWSLVRSFEQVYNKQAYNNYTRVRRTLLAVVAVLTIAGIVGFLALVFLAGLGLLG